MTFLQLNNLVKVGQLKTELGSQSEFNGVLRSGKVYRLDELLGGITDINLHEPIGSGETVGAEVW